MVHATQQSDGVALVTAFTKFSRTKVQERVISKVSKLGGGGIEAFSSLTIPTIYVVQMGTTHPNELNKNFEQSNRRITHTALFISHTLPLLA